MTEQVLTPDEVAALLRVDRADVDRLLERGELQGFKVAGEWRVLGIAVVEFLKQAMEEERQAALARLVGDPDAFTEPWCPC